MGLIPENAYNQNRNRKSKEPPRPGEVEEHIFVNQETILMALSKGEHKKPECLLQKEKAPHKLLQQAPITHHPTSMDTQPSLITGRRIKGPPYPQRVCIGDDEGQCNVQVRPENKLLCKIML